MISIMTLQSDYPITKIEAQEIEDSKRNPTIKVTVYSGDVSASFSVPSGASTGTHEAHELRDPEPEQARYGAGSDGKGGMKKAIWNIENIIAPVLVGQNVLNQKEIDTIMIELDGTLNKDNLGGNSTIGVSIACAKVAAKVKGIEVFEYLRTLAEIKPSRRVPHLFMNLLEGGKHTGNVLAFQEYLVVPNTEDVAEAVDTGIKIQNTLKDIIVRDLGKDSVVLGDEGGFAPKINDVRKPLVYLSEAINKNNLQDKVRLSLDVAANSFYKDSLYEVDKKSTRPNDRSVGRVYKEELMSIYNSLIAEFNLFSIEDPFNEEDFESFKKLRDGNRNFFVVGDDLTVSNSILLKKAIKKGSINAIIIKPNQIGTLTETLQTMKLARENGIELIISHRGEETDDDFIADIAYAFYCFGLKAGAPTKPERMIKYKRLIHITNLLLK